MKTPSFKGFRRTSDGESRRGDEQSAATNQEHPLSGIGSSEFRLIPIDQLELDKRNSRVAKWVEMHGGNVPAEQLSLALGAGDSQMGDSWTTFTSLRESIKTNGGVIHPIIVNEEPSGRLLVIEGNTRTLIYRQFRDREVAGDWCTIPAMVYTSLPDEDIDAIRLQAHLVGPREWDPYSKAKYLDLLWNKKHLTTDQIVDFCGGRKREVENHIAAFHDMEKHYRPHIVVAVDHRYSHACCASPARAGLPFTHRTAATRCAAPSGHESKRPWNRYPRNTHPRVQPMRLPDAARQALLLGGDHHQVHLVAPEATKSSSGNRAGIPGRSVLPARRGPGGVSDHQPRSG